LKNFDDCVKGDSRYDNTKWFTIASSSIKYLKSCFFKGWKVKGRADLWLSFSSIFFRDLSNTYSYFPPYSSAPLTIASTVRQFNWSGYITIVPRRPIEKDIHFFFWHNDTLSDLFFSSSSSLSFLLQPVELASVF